MSPELLRTTTSSSEITLPEQDKLTQTVPLRQVRQSERPQLEYVSAVALKSAQLFQQSPLQVATNLAQRLNEMERNPEAKLRKTPSDDTVLDEIQPYFEFEVVPQGWIFFRLATPGLAVWLQLLIDFPLPLVTSIVARDTSTLPGKSRFLMQTAASARNSTSVFPILHTYARCHSQLRLGQELGLIQVESSSAIGEVGLAADPLQLIQSPHPFPWLLPDGEFRGSQPVAWQLIEQICATLDNLAHPALAAPAKPTALVNREAALKQADRLSQSWQTFYAQCRIADEVRQTDPAQAQIRLGLTWITQKLLHLLLRSIGLPTPLLL